MATFPIPLHPKLSRRWPAPRRMPRLRITRCPSRHESNHKRFPFSNFTYYLTPFPRCFSSFDHSTCALSVSSLYLALEEIYLPLCAAFPNYATLRRGPIKAWIHTVRGSHPLWRPVPGNSVGTLPGAQSTDYNSDPHTRARFQIWAVAASLAVTEAIPVGFFSSAY